ncbi:MAG: hypothetical protein HYZ75_07395 [Elusimicrobia bacterium]|nr:hypothetical protein [Elusimicrobiota bacterium]
MRKAAGLALVTGALALAGWGAWRFLVGGFTLSGSVTASPHTRKRIATPNMMLFVVALNTGGVPVAVKRFVNPHLPLQWDMGVEDLILPGRDWSGPLSVRVAVNGHGKIGEALKGDLYGEHRHPARSGDRSVDVVVDSVVD